MGLSANYLPEAVVSGSHQNQLVLMLKKKKKNYWKDSICISAGAVKDRGHESGVADGHLVTIRTAWLTVERSQGKRGYSVVSCPVLKIPSNPAKCEVVLRDFSFVTS